MQDTWFWQTMGWVEIEGLEYKKDDNVALFSLVQPEDDDGFKHLILYNFSTSTQDRITFGRRVVLSKLSWDQENNRV